MEKRRGTATNHSVTASMAPMIIVVGVPGSGKSVVLSALEAQDSLVRVLNYGKEMLVAAGKAEIDRDRMRALAPEEQVALGQAAARSIVEKANVQAGLTTIVDTHALVKSPYGYVPGLPQHVLRILQPRAICVIEASPSFVAECRLLDGKRSRDQASIEEIARHQELTRQFAVSCSAMSSCVLQFVNNDGQAPSKIAKPLLELIQHIRS